MLFVSLIVSAILLLIANRAVRRSKFPGTIVGLTGFGFAAAPIVMMCIMPAVAIQSLLLWIAVIVWRNSDRRPSDFLRLSCGATVLAYGLAGILVFRSEQEYARLRRLYPYESMEARIPAPKGGTLGTALPTASEVTLSAIERKITDDPNGMRERQFRLLHEDAVGLFVNSPGFGVARMFLPAEWNMRFFLRREGVPLQPGAPSDGMWSPGEWKSPTADDRAPLRGLLEESVFDFVNSRGFGYFRDRRHVAGFESHRFSGVPQPARRWTVQTLELVSLLLHDEPGVYVSDHLPAMGKPHETPVRPLDRFERFGLETLERGEDLFVSDAGGGLRMLGAVRSIKQCVKCHGGNRGDLLGAFSYALRAEGPEIQTARR